MLYDDCVANNSPEQRQMALEQDQVPMNPMFEKQLSAANEELNQLRLAHARRIEDLGISYQTRIRQLESELADARTNAALKLKRLEQVDAAPKAQIDRAQIDRGQIDRGQFRSLFALFSRPASRKAATKKTLSPTPSPQQSPDNLTGKNEVKQPTAKAKSGNVVSPEVKQEAKRLSDAGLAAADANDMAKAKAFLEESLALWDGAAWTWSRLTRVAIALSDDELAEKAVRRALTLDPKMVVAAIQISQLYLGKERIADAIYWLCRASEVAGDNLKAHDFVISKLASLGATFALDNAIERMAIHHPTSPNLIYARIRSLLDQKQYAEAAEQLDAIESKSDNLLGLSIRLHCEQGAPIHAWALAKERPAGSISRTWLTQISNALRDAGELGLAIESRQRIIDEFPSEPQQNSSLDELRGQYAVLSGNWSVPAIPCQPLQTIPGRVLHVVGKSFPHTLAGYTVRTHYLVRAQRAHGIDAQVVTALGYPSEKDVANCPREEMVDGVPHHRLLTSSPLPTRADEFLSVAVRELVQLARHVRPAAFHAHSDYHNVAVALAAGKILDIPVIYEVRGFWEETWLSTRSNIEQAMIADAYRLRKQTEFRCMAEARHVVTLAETMKTAMIERGLPASKITLVRNAVETSSFEVQDRDPDLALSLGIQDDEVVVGYISSIVGYEGIKYLVSAIAELLRRGKKVRGLIVGDGKARAGLEIQASRLGLGDRCIFTGRVPHEEVQKYYSMIDIFVVPRTNDRVCQLVTPLKPYEAMASGRPVIVSGTPALTEMIEQGVSGLSFIPEDSTDLANVIQTLVDDPERRKELGRTAREWVCKNREWSVNGKIYADLYRSLGIMPSSPP